MSLHSHCRLKLVVTALTLLYSALSFSQTEDVVVNPITPGSLPALTADNLSSNVFFPLYPRLNVSGGTGNNNYGAADVMAPLFGSPSAIIYTDVGGQTGKGKSNFLSLGFGARDAVNDDLMWGGYAFVDRSKATDSDGGNHWTVINPGIEFMTNNWDGRVNGYIPTGSRENIRGPFFANQVNMPAMPSGHDVFSQLFNKVNEVGPGADADAGYTFTSLRRLRVHAGGYYFALPDTGDIKGGEAGIEMPINNYAALQFDDSYDDVQRNNAVVSVRFTLGGIDKFANDPTVQDRILDPIYRHLGALGTNTGIPSNSGIVELIGPPVLQQSNVWFFDANSSTPFNPSAGLNNCTFEHPCRGPDFTQGNINFINGIDSDANFYFTPGSYTINPSPLMSSSNILDLNSGQSMWGRTSNFSMPASPSSGFPTFIGEIDPQGNNTLDSFALNNSAGSQPIGIHVQNANNVLMNNLQIGQPNTADSYATSIQLDNANNITVENSAIQSLGAANGNLTGVNYTGVGTVNLTNNVFTLTTSGNSGTIMGINNTSTGSMNLTGNHFIQTNAASNASNTGIFNSGSGTVTATSNIFDITNTGVSSSPIAVGINNAGTLHLTGNTFTITALQGGVYGFFGAGPISLNNNTFTLRSNVSITGIAYNSIGTISGSHNTFTLTGTGTNLGGTNAGSTFLSNPANNNTCTINGSPC